MIPFILSLLLVIILSALVILIVGRLGLGLEVDNVGTAVVAALVIALVGFIFTWILAVLNIPTGSGLIGAVVNLIVAAVVIMLSGNFVEGMRVKGFGGAIIAAISISVLTFIVNWIIGLLGL